MQIEAGGGAGPMAAIVIGGIDTAARPTDEFQVAEGCIDATVTGGIDDHIRIGVAGSGAHLRPGGGAG